MLALLLAVVVALANAQCASLFSAPPGSASTGSPGTADIGSSFTVDASVCVTGVRFFINAPTASPSASATYTAQLFGSLVASGSWYSSGTSLASGSVTVDETTLTAGVPTAFTVTFPAPVQINAATPYVVSYLHPNPNGGYYNAGGTAPVTVSGVTATASGYNQPGVAGGFPTTFNGAGLYAIEPVFSAACTSCLSSTE